MYDPGPSSIQVDVYDAFRTLALHSPSQQIFWRCIPLARFRETDRSASSRKRGEVFPSAKALRAVPDATTRPSCPSRQTSGGRCEMGEYALCSNGHTQG